MGEKKQALKAHNQALTVCVLAPLLLAATGCARFPGTPATSPPPVTFACSANPSSVFPGEPVTITGTSSELNPKNALNYTWTGAGATGSGPSVTVATATLAPGTYTVHGTVREGSKPAQSADCSAQFTIKSFEPPAIACTADPGTIQPGDTSEIRAYALSPQHYALTYSYSASTGSISGSGPSATYSAVGAPLGATAIGCTVTDSRGNTATAYTTVTVAANLPPQPPPPPAPRLPQETPADTPIHASGLLVPHTRESADFGLYTYILTKSLPTTEADTQRLHNLVRGALAQGAVEGFGYHAVEPTGPEAPALPPVRTDNVVNKKSLAVIYIPVVAPYPATEPQTVEAEATWIVEKGHYDVDAAQKLLLNLACQSAAISSKNCASQFRETGPYLVSTLIALSVNHPQRVLLQNLTATTPSMAEDWVRQFEQMTSASANWNGSTLSNLLLPLGAMLDRYGQSLTSAKQALASAVSLFGWNKSQH